jgi:uncharacterized protein
MKWTIHELVKLEHVNNEIDELIDLSSYIEGTDIVAISPVHVVGDFEVYDREEFVFYLDIDCTLTLECAITLKEVLYPMNLSVEESFTTFQNDDSTIIEGITIDLLPIIWSNILLEKPMRVLSEDAYENFDLGNTEFEDEEDTQNAFAKLKDYEK